MIRMNNLPPYFIVWMELTNLILSEERHKRYIPYDSAYVKFKKAK